MHRQKRIFDWSVETYGPSAATFDERALRFLEEALELAQACGIEEDMVGRLAARVYEQEPGPVFKELGQTALMLEALSECRNTDLDEAANAEFERIEGLPKSHFEARHAAKVARGIAS